MNRLIAAALLFTAGCGIGSGGDALRDRGEDDTGPYEVVVNDETGYVTDVQARLPDHAIGGSGAAPLVDDPSALAVWWVGSACDQSSSVTVGETSGGDLRIDIAEDHGPGCDDVGVPRGAVLLSDRSWVSALFVNGP